MKPGDGALTHDRRIVSTWQVVGFAKKGVGTLSFVWTEERVQILRQVWSEDYAAIHRALGVSEDELSNDAIKNKARRLQLKAPDKRRTNGRKKAEPADPACLILAKWRVLPKVDYLLVRHSGLGETIWTIESERCRWPVGDPRSEGFYLCGNEADIGTDAYGEPKTLPYCKMHCADAHQPPHRSGRIRLPRWTR
jgi:GcrA cell cycle regulator